MDSGQASGCRDASMKLASSAAVLVEDCSELQSCELENLRKGGHWIDGNSVSR